MYSIGFLQSTADPDLSLKLTESDRYISYGQVNGSVRVVDEIVDWIGHRIGRKSGARGGARGGAWDVRRH